jgi:hypothetical protein
MPLISEKVYEKIGAPFTIWINGIGYDKSTPATDRIQAKFFAINSPLQSIVVKTGKTNDLFPFHVYQKHVSIF